MMGQFVVDPAPTLVGMGSADESALIVYPNPSSGASTLMLPAGRTAAFYQVFDPLGRIVASASGLSGTPSFPLPHLGAGLYMIRVTDDRGAMLSTHFMVRP